MLIKMVVPMSIAPEKYFLVPRGVIDTELDLLVSPQLSLFSLDFVMQRKLVKDHGTIFLTPIQYFCLRRYAAERNAELDGILCSERKFERFDQVIDFHSDPFLVYNRPKIDFDSDEIKLEDPLEAPYLLEFGFLEGFLFEDLDRDTGLPKQPSNRFDQNWDGGWRFSNPTNWEELRDAYEKLVTPVFRARDGMDYLHVDPVYNVDMAYDKLGVRECLLAKPDSLKRLSGRIVHY